MCVYKKLVFVDVFSIYFPESFRAKSVINGATTYFPDHAISAAYAEKLNNTIYKIQNKNPSPGIKLKRKYKGRDPRKRAKRVNPCHA